MGYAVSVCLSSVKLLPKLRRTKGVAGAGIEAYRQRKTSKLVLEYFFPLFWRVHDVSLADRHPGSTVGREQLRRQNAVRKHLEVNWTRIV